MNVNILAVVIASVLEFIVGAVWYSPLMFGNIWMKIHHCDGLSKEELQKMQKEMGPYYGVQFVATLVTTFVLAMLHKYLPEFSTFFLAFWLWVGFVVPTQVSAIIFGGDEKKWFPTKIAIISGSSLVCLMIAAAVLSMM